MVRKGYLWPGKKMISSVLQMSLTASTILCFWGRDCGQQTLGFFRNLSCFHCVKWLIESNFVADIWLHILCFPSLGNFFMFCHTWVCCDVTKRELGLTTNTEVLKRNVKAPESLDNDKVLWFHTSQQLHSMKLTHTSSFLHLLGKRIRKKVKLVGLDKNSWNIEKSEI